MHWQPSFEIPHYSKRNLFEAASELDAEPVLAFSMDVSVGEALADRVEAFTGRSFEVDLHQDPWVEAATHIAQSVLEETRHRDA